MLIHTCKYRYVKFYTHAREHDTLLVSTVSNAAKRVRVNHIIKS